MRVVPINNNAGTTGINGTCPGQAVWTVSSPILNLIPPDGHFTSFSSHVGFWNVPRIGGACSCLRIFEVTVPKATHYMPCHTHFGVSVQMPLHQASYHWSLSFLCPGFNFPSFIIAFLLQFYLCYLFNVCPTKTTSPWRQGLRLDHCWIQNTVWHIVGAQLTLVE